jgi:hypothetical protein
MTMRSALLVAGLVVPILGAAGNVLAGGSEPRDDDLGVATARRSVLLPMRLDDDFDLEFEPGGPEPGHRAAARWRPSADGTSADAAAESLTHGAGVTLDFEPVSLGAWQDDPPPADAKQGGDGGSLAETATNPVGALVQLQFQYLYVGESNAGDNSSHVFTIQPVIPWKLGETQMLSRITLPILVATPDLGEPIDREYGIGDTISLNFATFAVDKGGPWQGLMGPGLALTLPTATSDFTGEGKWQAGPGFVYINTATKGLQWGGFCYQQWSFASAGGESGRREVSKFYFQPVITKHFEGGWYIALQDLLWTIDWNDNARWSLPVGLRFGRVTKWDFLGGQPVNVFIEPFYDVSGNNAGNEWGVKFNLTLLFPGGGG